MFRAAAGFVEPTFLVGEPRCLGEQLGELCEPDGVAALPAWNHLLLVVVVLGTCCLTGELKGVAAFIQMPMV